MSNDIGQDALEANELSNIYTYRVVSIDKLKYEYEIAVSSDYIELKINSRLREIAKGAKFPGFRSGRMPYGLVVTNYKDEAFRYVIKDTIDYCSGDLIKKIEVKSHIHPKVDIISLPNLDEKGKKNNFLYKLSFESMPEVPVIDLDRINLKKIKAKITEKDIQEFIDSIKIKFPSFLPVNDISYQAKNKDRLIIDFEGRIRNKLFQGGRGNNSIINLGSGAFINGFQDQLIGMKKGEKKSFKLKFPENYHVISLAGQEATFSVRVNDIHVIKDLQSDNEIAKNIGFEDHSLLRNHVKEIIDNQCKEMEDLLIKKELFDYLDASYNFDLPIEVVKQEQQRIEKELNTKDTSREEAEKRVKLAMLFMEFSKKYKISLTQSDIMNTISNKYVSKNVSFDRVFKHFKSEAQFQKLIKGQALEYKVTDYMIKKVNKEEQIVSVKELKKLFNNI